MILVFMYFFKENDCIYEYIDFLWLIIFKRYFLFNTVVLVLDFNMNCGVI